MVTQEERELIHKFCTYPVPKMFNGVQRRRRNCFSYFTPNSTPGALMELMSSVLPDFSQSKDFKTYFKASGYSDVDTLDEILSVCCCSCFLSSNMEHRTRMNQCYFRDIFPRLECWIVSSSSKRTNISLH